MKKLYYLVKQALKGDENQDYTSLSINKAIFLLSVPMVIEMVFESFFALIDAFFVAKYVGVNGVATVGLTESVITLIYSLAWGTSTAATALIARRIGEKKKKEASETLTQLFLIATVLGVLLAIIGFVYSGSILKLMGGSSELIEEGIWYTRISFLSSPIIMLLFTFGGAFRGAGNASIAMRAMIIANLFNIFLDFIFVPILEMGVKGAAIATFIGRGIGLGYQLYVLFKGEIQINLNRLKPDFKLIKKILQLTGGGAGQFIIQSASWVFLTRILASFGTEVVAGYTIAIRIIIFSILPSWGMANSAATLVGQNLGAGKPDRAATSAYRASFLNIGFLVLVALFFFSFARPIVHYFSTEARVVETAVVTLKILCAGYLFFGFGMVMSQAINGAVDTITPTILNLVCFWAIEIPLAYYLAKSTSLNEFGVFYAIIISETVLAVLALLYFRSGRWKTKMV